MLYSKVKVKKVLLILDECSGLLKGGVVKDEHGEHLAKRYRRAWRNPFGPPVEVHPNLLRAFGASPPKSG